MGLSIILMVLLALGIVGSIVGLRKKLMKIWLPSVILTGLTAIAGIVVMLTIGLDLMG